MCKVLEAETSYLYLTSLCTSMSSRDTSLCTLSIIFFPQLHFLCDPSISASDPIVTSAIEAAKLRQMALSKELSREMITKAKGSQEEPSLVVSQNSGGA